VLLVVFVRPRLIMKGLWRQALCDAVASCGYLHTASATVHGFTITQVVAIFKAGGTNLIDMCVTVDALVPGVI